MRVQQVSELPHCVRCIPRAREHGVGSRQPFVPEMNVWQS